MATNNMTREEIDEMFDSECIQEEEKNKKISIKVGNDELTNNKGAIRRKVEANNYKKVDTLRWNRDPESIKIDEDGDVTCPAWGYNYIKGTGDNVKTVELINRYIEECHKMKEERDFSFIEMIEKVPEIEDDEIEDIIYDENRPKISNMVLEEFL